MKRIYDKVIQESAQRVLDIMNKRVQPEETAKLLQAFEFARKAHADQYRRSGEPYIVHPIAVANIVAEELHMDTSAVCAAFLHDIVEDTPYTLEDIKELFGEDVAGLVKALTKPVKEHYEMSKQEDNYKQILGSIQMDIRSLLVKLADRLHNMRTLSSMPPHKQMKIAGETDFFYAPLANRLGLYNVKIELENLSFRYRCPHEYQFIQELIERDRAALQKDLEGFTGKIKDILAADGVMVDVKIVYRQPYSLWRKMRKTNCDFNHIPYRHIIQVIFTCHEVEGGLPCREYEKKMALKIYAKLTNVFREKPSGILNYINSPKENGYQSFHVQMLSDFGSWEELHICSERMVMASQLGVVDQQRESSVQRWLGKFRSALKDMEYHQNEGNYIEDVVSTFYNDDIMVFTPKGQAVNLPKRATALDFAFEIHTHIGLHAHYARINGQLNSVKAELHRGDLVEIVTSENVSPKRDWMDAVLSYKAKRALKTYCSKQLKSGYHYCPKCNPIPGEEVVGFKEADGSITVHRRNCPLAISSASKKGDSIVSVDYKVVSNVLYPVSIHILAIDRYRLLCDIIDCITNEMHLSMHSINTTSSDCIVNSTISFGVHSNEELLTIMARIKSFEGVEEVRRIF